MSSIFNHAVNALKGNADSKEAPRGNSRTRESSTRDVDSNKSGSILNRIKLNKKPGKNIKSITIRKNSEDDGRRFDIENIQRKVIKKDITSLKYPVKKTDTNDVWKHDLYDGPTAVPSVNTYCTVFIRNLPDQVDGQYIKEILKEDRFVVGIRV